MIKELQERVAKLQAERTLNEKEFMQKKQHYEDIIQQLQEDNHKLRRFIEDNSNSLHSAPDSPPRSDPPHEPLPDLQRENAMLKQELQTITRIYEEQVEEMTLYFNKIKEAYARHARPAPDPQLPALMTAYQQLMDHFDAERAQFVAKIEELAHHIQLTEERERQLQLSNRQLQLDLDILKEELRIYKRAKLPKN